MINLSFLFLFISAVGFGQSLDPMEAVEDLKVNPRAIASAKINIRISIGKTLTIYKIYRSKKNIKMEFLQNGKTLISSLSEKDFSFFKKEFSKASKFDLSKCPTGRIDVVFYKNKVSGDKKEPEALKMGSCVKSPRGQRWLKILKAAQISFVAFHISTEPAPE